jgi:hypothetical protein
VPRRQFRSCDALTTAWPDTPRIPIRLTLAPGMR